MNIVTAHRLAHEIEWIHAKDRARLLSRGRYRCDPELEFDPHAATELGNWIYNVAAQELRTKRKVK